MKNPSIYYEIKNMFGSDLSSTKLATQLGKDILNDIDLGFNVEVDFKDVRSVTSGWARNAFGLIVRDKGYEFFKQHIFVINTNKSVRKTMLEGIGDILI